MSFRIHPCLIFTLDVELTSVSWFWGHWYSELCAHVSVCLCELCIHVLYSGCWVPSSINALPYSFGQSLSLIPGRRLVILMTLLFPLVLWSQACIWSCPAFYMGIGGLNLSPHAWVASIFIHSSQPLYSEFLAKSGVPSGNLFVCLCYPNAVS